MRLHYILVKNCERWIYGPVYLHTPYEQLWPTYSWHSSRVHYFLDFLVWCICIWNLAVSVWYKCIAAKQSWQLLIYSSVILSILGTHTLLFRYRLLLVHACWSSCDKTITSTCRMLGMRIHVLYKTKALIIVGSWKMCLGSWSFEKLTLEHDNLKHC